MLYDYFKTKYSFFGCLLTSIQLIHSLVLTDLMVLFWLSPNASESPNVLAYLPWLTLHASALNYLLMGKRIWP